MQVRFPGTSRRASLARATWWPSGPLLSIHGNLPLCCCCYRCHDCYCCILYRDESNRLRKVLHRYCFLLYQNLLVLYLWNRFWHTHTHMRFVSGCCLPQTAPKSSKHFIVQAFAKTRNWALTHQLHQPTSCDAMFSLSFSPTIIMVIADCPSLEQWFSLIWVISNFTLCLNFWNILSSCSQCTRRKM